MIDAIALLFDTSGFPPRWLCGNWTRLHGLVHIISDFAIAGAYAAIPIALTVFIRRRNDVPFAPLFWLFVTFIACCGVTHFIEATIFWTPVYRLSGLMKATTAIVSWITVIALLPVIPKALAFPGLVSANEKLAEEVEERKQSEVATREAYEKLEIIAGAAIDREQRVLDLKREVNTLARQLGQDELYTISGD